MQAKIKEKFEKNRYFGMNTEFLGVIVPISAQAQGWARAQLFQLLSVPVKKMGRGKRKRDEKIDDRKEKNVRKWVIMPMQ